jgi:hypothetical protein
MVGHYIDSGSKDYSVEAAISKVFGTEALWSCANESLQIAGGNGFMKEYPYEKVVRDSRINMIFEGTNEILRLYIALSGMKDVGDYLKDVLKSAGSIFNEPIKGFGILSEYAAKRFSRLTSLGRERIESHHPLLENEATVVERYAQLFAAATDGIIRRHGKEVVNKQFAMKRLADTVIDLFACLCVISRVSRMLEEDGEERSAEALLIARTFVKQARRRMTGNLRRIDINEDENLAKLSDFLVEREGYPWDIF